MDTLTATFTLPGWIAEGLASGAYERVGGVIRETGTKQIVSWLREADASNLSGIPGLLRLFSGLPLPADPVSGALNLVAQGVNAGISIKGFRDVKKGLSQLGEQIQAVRQDVQEVQGTLRVASAISILNLGVSVMGFAIINQRLNELEKHIVETKELLSKIGRKIDLAHYANFKAALGLATNALTMGKQVNRDSMAIQAINRFLEAQHIYSDYLSQDLSQGSRFADGYFLTLVLAYIAEVRCHLELDEIGTALSRLDEAEKATRSFTEKYIKILLTSNPLVYLHPRLKGQSDLRRLTQIYQLINSELDENAVFELHRENFFKIVQEKEKWVESLPAAIWDDEIDWVDKGFWEDRNPYIYRRLRQSMGVMESVVETYRRLRAYQSELQAIAQLGVSFHDWVDLAPSEAKPKEAELIYIIPSKPLAVDD